uniref:histidine kinase n=1 Tax=Roseihalotalea indica TaxID=2867963 RepID=A0AA49JGZ9_9BACT|nr:sensor histidine kinase [Tunicatimonas sp. TK19036]
MNKPEAPITEVILENELDLILAHKKAMKLAEVSGLSFTDQTKFTTAVSEICRNVLVHADKGDVKFRIIQHGLEYCVEAIITDQGPGIKDVESLLNASSSLHGNRKNGIINSQKLSDVFEIKSRLAEGTQVCIGKKLPSGHPPINPLILSGWRKYFSELSPISPYDELKKQNHRLLQTLEELKSQKNQTQEKLEEIQRLNQELKSNYEQISQLSDDIARQNSLLKKRNEDLDGFAYIVSHDLKSPISNLQGLLRMLEEGRLQPERGIPMFKGQLDKVEKLISNILSYSRAGHEQVDKTAVDLNQLIHEIIGELQQPENFSIELEHPLPTLLTEEILIYQIFSNLLTNAVKYNDKPEGRVKIGTSNTPEGAFYYYVEDNGPGIPEGKRESVFKMFTVLQKIDGVDSSGLGLAIIKKIIGERGGEIWVQNSAFSAMGSRFCFTWPAETITNS